MGYRLHVAKVYKVEYALGDAFNYMSKNFTTSCLRVTLHIQENLMTLTLK